MPPKLKPSERRQKGQEEAKAAHLIKTRKQLLRDSPTDPWAREQLGRRTDYLRPKKRILIVCEGEKTEPYYFESLKTELKLPIFVETVEGQGDPLSVVESAVTYKSKNRGKYDDIWAVFDRDDFDVDRVHKAFELAKNNKIKIAFTNEAFEVWYILHYKFIQTPTSRDGYKKELSKFIKKEYKKNDRKMFTILRPNLRTAILNASNATSGIAMYAKDAISTNPYTGVHHLVCFLIKSANTKEINSLLKAYKK